MVVLITGVQFLSQLMSVNTLLCSFIFHPLINRQIKRIIAAIAISKINILHSSAVDRNSQHNALAHRLDAHRAPFSIKFITLLPLVLIRVFPLVSSCKSCVKTFPEKPLTQSYLHNKQDFYLTLPHIVCALPHHKMGIFFLKRSYVQKNNDVVHAAGFRFPPLRAHILCVVLFFIFRIFHFI